MDADALFAAIERADRAHRVAPAAPSTAVTISVFASLVDPIVRAVRHGTWEDFAASLARPLPRTIPKDALPLWSLAEFRDAYREDANVHSITGLTLDVDVEPIPDLDGLVAALEGLRSIVYSSSSATRESARWRASIALSRPVSSGEYRRVSRCVRALLPFAVGSASGDPARAWYYPREGSDGYYAYRSLDGAPIDVDELLRGLPPDDGPMEIVSPIAIDAAHPEYAERVAWFEELCSSCPPPTNGGETFRIASRGTRSAELPPDRVLDVLWRVLRPRCARPLERHEWGKVERLVENTIECGTFAVGTAHDEIVMRRLQRELDEQRANLGPVTDQDLAVLRAVVASAPPDAARTELGNVLASLDRLGERREDGSREADCPRGHKAIVSARGRWKCADPECQLKTKADVFRALLATGDSNG